MDGKTLIAKSLFKKETNLELFLNMSIILTPSSPTNHSTSEAIGRIESTFGQSGKVKCYFQSGIGDDVLKSVNSKRKSDEGDGWKLVLRFKRYFYDMNKRMIQ